MKYWIRIGVSMLLLAGIGAARAAELDGGDARFMAQAAQAGAFEVEASRWAEQNGEHEEVKRYAARMIADHTKIASELKALAAAKGVSLPSALSDSQARTLKALQGDTGARLDMQYADEVAIVAHNEAVKLFVEAGEQARDPEVKAFAQQALPGLKAHLDAGIALRKTLAASGKASPEENQPAGAAPGTVSPASRHAPPSLLPGDKGAPKP